jgi:hypothetical protein
MLASCCHAALREVWDAEVGTGSPKAALDTVNAVLLGTKDQACRRWRLLRRRHRTLRTTNR